MDIHSLPPFPTDLGFEFKSQTLDELRTLWGCSKRTLCTRISKVRDLLGVHVGKLYTPEQIIIMCLIWEPPNKYYNAFQWMEVSGWKEYYAKKYNMEEWLDPIKRNILLAERFNITRKIGKPKKKNTKRKK